MTDWSDVNPPYQYVQGYSDIKEGDSVWAIDDGSSGTVDSVWDNFDDHNLSEMWATVVWDRTGCAGDILLIKLRKTEP